MSYGQAHGLPVQTAYISLAGAGGREILARICEAAKERGANEIIDATDNDENGMKKGAQLAEVAEAAGLGYRREIPPGGVKDWNDLYCAYEDQDLTFEDACKASFEARLQQEGDPFTFCRAEPAAADFSPPATPPAQEQGHGLGD